MKNLIIIIGTILLGAIIVNTLILGDGNSLKSASENVMRDGVAAIEDAVNFGGNSGGGGTGSGGGGGTGSGGGGGTGGSGGSSGAGGASFGGGTP